MPTKKKSDEQDVENDTAAEPKFKGMGSLLQTGAFSDFKIYVGRGKTEYKVHKAVLAEHSQYFKTMFESQGFKEAKDNELHLKDHTDRITAKVLRWLYTGRFREEGDNKTGPFYIDVCAKIFADAGYLEIPALKSQAVADCVKALEYKHYGIGEKNNDRFVEAVQLLFGLYDNEAKGLDPFMDALISKKMLKVVLASEELKESMLENPEVAVRLLEGQVSRCK